MCGLVGSAARPLPSAGLQRLAARFSSGPVPGPAAMQTAVVRCVPTESKLTISLQLGPSQRHMQREQSESLRTALGRIAHNLLKAQAKVGKGRRGAQAESPAQAQAESPAQAQASAPPVVLYRGDEPVPGDTTNADAWQDGAVLQVGEARYRVERNPPTLTQLRLPASILAGFPLCPRVELEFGDASHSRFEWLRGAGGGDWQPVAEGRVFTPSNGHIGLRLKLRCQPGDGRRFGAAVEVESGGPVEAGPGACSFDSRQRFSGQAPEEPLLRLVSYNILADVYAQTELSRNTLYPYCPPYALEAHYRQNLILKELSGYNADIICLQEVDKSAFTDSLGPALDAFGFRGMFRMKEKQHEGLATFFRASKFGLISQHDVTFSQALASDPLHQELLEKVSANPCVKEKVLQRSTTFQVCVLQSLKDPSKKLCVGNTHLYWHPKGGHIRLVQIAIAFRHLERVTAEMYPDTPVIFCGDFNSTPNSGLYEFVTKGHISADHPDWISNGEEERCSMSLTHPFRLKSACGEPTYTNYVGGFQGCLDYIFMDMNMFEVSQVIPFPSHEEVTCHLALPSVSHPSDHIALICDLKFK